MVMTLSTGMILRPALATVNDTARAVAAVVCAGSAGVHAVLAPEHLEQSMLLGAAFAGDSLLLAVASVLVSHRRGRHVLPVAGLLGVTALAYVLSRTSGLPGLVPDAEPIDGLGALTTLSELVGVAACLLLTLRRNADERDR